MKLCIVVIFPIVEIIHIYKLINIVGYTSLIYRNLFIAFDFIFLKRAKVGEKT